MSQPTDPHLGGKTGRLHRGRGAPKGPARFAAVARLAWLTWVTVLVLTSIAHAQAASEGTISGRVFDAESGAAIEGATVILLFPDPGDGTEATQLIATSGPAGDYEFDAVPVGAYSLSFIKSGFRASSMTNFSVEGGRDNVADFPMPPVAATAGGDILELDAFVVEADVVGDLMEGLELRLESDQMLNLLSAEDLSRYAASDVADALKRVAGVNIVEGQFAVVRGLEDRYSSTLFNGAPVPSPDPDSQSVQLDLFPSDVVTNLVIAKSFAGSAPSNSAAGSIDIVTLDYPDETEFKLSLGSGFEENAIDRFIEFESGSTTGVEAEPEDVTETDVTASLGGRETLFGQEIRFKAVVNHEIDYASEIGSQETLEPALRLERQQRVGPPIILAPGDLAFGELGLSDGRFDQIESTRDEQLTAYLALGIDLDEEEKHKVDFLFFFTKKEEETVELRENGFLPGADYSTLVEVTRDGTEDLLGALRTLDPFATRDSRLAGAESALRTEVSDSPERGALWFSSFGRTNTFERNRDLKLYQLNGEHEFDLAGGIDVSWAANHATTSQEERSRGMRFFYEPCGYAGQFPCAPGVSRVDVPSRFPVKVSDLGPGSFFAAGAAGGIVFSNTDIKEAQWFGRVDLEKDIEPLDFLALNLKGGVWWEKSRRTVDALFVDAVGVRGESQFQLGSPTLPELGRSFFNRVDSIDANRSSTSRAGRELVAGHATIRATLWEDLDLFAGVRLEQIQIDSENDPFTGGTELGNRPQIFPTAYLFFDRRDNPNTSEASVAASRSGAVFNDQILGINTPINPSTGFVDLLTREQILEVVNGEIDEFKALPSVGLTYRPVDGLTIRGSYSETVARPSFREIGYYVTIEPGTDDRVVGNPQLTLSEVTSFDARVEYVYGDLGDLFAFSAFYKTIENPIESIVLRNPLDFDSASEALFRTFFNNPSTARLTGIEIEGRKSFDFLGFPALDYLSIGGNFTYIEAKVKRIPAELERAQRFFGAPGDTSSPFTNLAGKRRLFGQPEWIVNADISYDNPDWGTTLTLSVFAISDVLERAGSTALGRDNRPSSAQLDRYLDEFYQLDFVASQRIWGGLAAKVSIKNLTDSARRRIYDPVQTARKFKERSRRIGRDWSFSLSYTLEF